LGRKCPFLMFRNLSTSTKLFILCSTFIVAIVVAIYSLVAEKEIAIQFARKELVGVRYLESLRGVYAAILAKTRTNADGQTASPEETLKSLDAAEQDAAGTLQTAALEQSLETTLRKLWSKGAEGDRSALIVEALAKACDLATRIGDDSNLAL